MEAKGHQLAADEGDEKEVVMVMARAEIQATPLWNGKQMSRIIPEISGHHWSYMVGSTSALQPPALSYQTPPPTKEQGARLESCKSPPANPSPQFPRFHRRRSPTLHDGYKCPHLPNTNGTTPTRPQQLEPGFESATQKGSEGIVPYARIRVRAATEKIEAVKREKRSRGRVASPKYTMGAAREDREAGIGGEEVRRGSEVGVGEEDADCKHSGSRPGERNGVEEESGGEDGRRGGHDDRRLKAWWVSRRG
ncbi:hypothetical protein B296_00036439 [Ensete ventricosum]|uniref:Uncharacterized protein n=1 Tax=Ensete ventricosum TaxID=4639 RepID=A0A427A2P2_ENSVE|nr:hypothetical protein B296_00036439 [Ensete ventricosum]